jgi:CubicO group peptidase (beta-lactamase class C family)
MKPLCALLVLVVAAAISAVAQVQKIRENPDFIAQVSLLDLWIQEEMEYRNLPGLAIAVIHDQDLVWSKGFGSADLGKKTPMTPQTLFRIASITKTFTSTAILQLRDRGKLQLDDPVSKYLPWFTYKNRFPEGPAVTIRQLLTHTSGLPRESAMPYWTEPRFPTHEEMVALLHSQESIFEPDTKWKYSNLGMAILGEVVAAVSGQSYDEFITKSILQPLNMTNSTVYPDKNLLSRYATPYGRRMADGTRKVSPVIDTKAITPAAGISSTVEDLGKFASLHMLDGRNIAGQILKGSTLREMHRVQWLLPNWRGGYGLGFSVRKLDDRVVYGHGGWVGGNKSQISISPKEKVAVIVAINADDGLPAFFADRAMSMLAPVIARLTTPVAPEARVDSSWTRFLGTYSDPYGWETRVMIMNNKLTMYDSSYPPEDNPLGGLTELTPEGPNTFRMSDDDGSGELIVFEMGKDGKVVRIKTGENYIYPKK